MVEVEIMTTLITMITSRQRCWKRDRRQEWRATTPASGRTEFGGGGGHGVGATGSKDGGRFDSAPPSLCQSSPRTLWLPK